MPEIVGKTYGANLTPARQLAWQDDALCAETDPEAFFPEKGSSPRPAKALCGKCDVREQCLQWALDNQIGFGVWGGTTYKERLRMERVQLGRGHDTPQKVADMVARGLTTAQISELLGMSPDYISRVRNRPQLKAG